MAGEIAQGRPVRFLWEYELDLVLVQLILHPSQRVGGIVRTFVEQATAVLRAAVCVACGAWCEAQWLLVIRIVCHDLWARLRR